MLARLTADFAYLLAGVLYLTAFLLILEWFVHLIPGWWLNPVKRFLFRLCFPLLKWGDAWFPLKVGALDFTPFFMALLMLSTAIYGVPWLILLSFSLRG